MLQLLHIFRHHLEEILHFAQSSIYLIVNVRKEIVFTFIVCCFFLFHRYTPDVVFLQELIPPYVQYLKKRAVSYLMIEGTVC